MTQNINNQNLDDVLSKIEDIYKSHYLGYKKHSKPYSDLITEVKNLDVTGCKEDLLSSLQEKISEKESFCDLELNTWGMIISISGILLAFSTDALLENTDSISQALGIETFYIILLAIIFFFVVFLEILLYCLATNTVRKKIKKKEFYKFVYNILSNYSVPS